MDDRLAAAVALAAQCHTGQVDKAGQPYILHPLRVMLRLGREEERIAAVLHDTVEDCGLEVGLIRHRFGAVVAEAVDALSRREGENYGDFIERCGANPLARKVKIADVQDNLDPSRIAEPTAEDARRAAKYHDALWRLMEIGRDAQGTSASG